MRTIGIIGTGYYVPSKILTNKDISKIIDTTDEWIYSKVGIKERRVASNHEATSDLGIYAGQRALYDAKLNPLDIDLIIVATSTPDMIQPSTAAIIQGKIGARNAVAFDVSAVCAGSVYAITIAENMMRANGNYKNALVIGAETYSRILDWTDRNTAVFFGDGAGAIVLSDVEPEFGIKNTFLMNDGTGASVIQFQGGGSRYPASKETLDKNLHRFEMQGKSVWDFATKAFPYAVKKVVEDYGDKVIDLDFVISHQANINIINKSLDTLGLDRKKTYTNIEKYGNTSGASVFLALAEADEKNLFRMGDRLCLVAFGGGLSYGAVYLKWGK